MKAAVYWALLALLTDWIIVFSFENTYLDDILEKRTPNKLKQLLASLEVFEQDAIPDHQVWSHCKNCYLSNGEFSAFYSVTTSNKYTHYSTKVTLSASVWAEFFSTGIYRDLVSCEVRELPPNFKDVVYNNKQLDKDGDLKNRVTSTYHIARPVFLVTMITFDHPGHIMVDLLEQLYNMMMKKYGRIRRDSIIIVNTPNDNENQQLYFGSSSEKKWGLSNSMLIDLLSYFTDTVKSIYFLIDDMEQIDGGVFFDDISFGLDVSDTFYYHGFRSHPYTWHPSNYTVKQRQLADSNGMFVGKMKRYMWSMYDFNDHNVFSNTSLWTQVSPADSAKRKVITMRVLIEHKQNNRAIMNIDEVVSLLKERSGRCLPCQTDIGSDSQCEVCIYFEYVVVNLEHTSAEEQLRLFHQCDVLIAPMGTALHNVIFMRHGDYSTIPASIVMLMEPLWEEYSWLYGNQAALLNIDSYSIKAKVYDRYHFEVDDEDSEKFTGYHRKSNKQPHFLTKLFNITVPIHALDKVFDDIIHKTCQHLNLSISPLRVNNVESITQSSKLQSSELMPAGEQTLEMFVVPPLERSFLVRVNPDKSDTISEERLVALRDQVLLLPYLLFTESNISDRNLVEYMPELFLCIATLSDIVKYGNIWYQGESVHYCVSYHSYRYYTKVGAALKDSYGTLIMWLQPGNGSAFNIARSEVIVHIDRSLANDGVLLDYLDENNDGSINTINKDGNDGIVHISFTIMTGCSKLVPLKAPFSTLFRTLPLTNENIQSKVIPDGMFFHQDQRTIYVHNINDHDINSPQCQRGESLEFIYHDKQLPNFAYQIAVKRFCIQHNLGITLCYQLQKQTLKQLLYRKIRRYYHDRMYIPPVQYRPTPQSIFVFLHVEKSGGTTTREYIAESAEKLGISSFVPCYNHTDCEVTHLPHPDIPPVNFSFVDTPAARAKAAEMTNQRNDIDLSSLSVLAGHFPWGIWQELPQCSHVTEIHSEHYDTSCTIHGLLMVRHPVDRIISQYYQRCYRAPACVHYQRHIHQLSAEELRNTVRYQRYAHFFADDGTAMIVDEGMSDALCRTLLGQRNTVGLVVFSNTSVPLPPPLTDNEVQHALNRVEQMIIGSIDKQHWPDTIKVINQWFPWIDFDQNFNKHLLQSPVKDKSSAKDLGEDLRRVIEEENACDMLIYDAAIKRFEDEVRIVNSKYYA